VTVVRPFRGLRYDARRVDLGSVLVPPYDVIAADERESFYARDPHSAIRLELTRDAADEADTDYGEVARTLAGWRREGILARDAVPALYAMRQRFRAPDGSSLARDGFFAELRLEDYAAGVVRPHEQTLSGPKADRLKLLRATRANLSSVFLLYEDPEQALAQTLGAALEGAAAVASEAADSEYTLVPLTDPAAVGRIQDFLSQRPVVIADGHHRYETALAYRDERRRAAPDAGSDAPFESTLAFFANAYAPGTLLLPIHRVVRKASVPTEAAWRRRLASWHQETLPLPGPEAIDALLARHLAPLAGRPAFAADDASGQLRVFSKREPLGDELLVRIVEREVLEGVFGLGGEAIREGAVAFPKSAVRAARDVRAGEGTVALYLNPLAPADVFRATAAGERMPQKSTFFYPKVPTGLVFRVHEDAA
jgi:uncharacterized protein (DUF1015 family)